MSIKMYNYRVKKSEFWTFALDCRAYYMRNYPVLTAMRSHSTTDAGGTESFRKRLKAVKRAGKEWSVDLQVFDEGDTYLLRPLEHGWYFGNNVRRMSTVPVSNVFYDDRADVPQAEKDNLAVANWVDEQISERRYLVFNVLGVDDFMDAAIPLAV